jgi:hypothetical protein
MSLSDTAVIILAVLLFVLTPLLYSKLNTIIAHLAKIATPETTTDTDTDDLGDKLDTIAEEIRDAVTEIDKSIRVWTPSEDAIRRLGDKLDHLGDKLDEIAHHLATRSRI